MNSSYEKSRSFSVTVLILMGIFHLVMARSIYLHLVELKADLFQSAWSGIVGLCILITLVCAWLAMKGIRGDSFIQITYFDHPRFATWFWRAIGVVIFLVIVYIIPYTKFIFAIGQEVKNPVYDPLFMLLGYYWLCWWLILLGMAALKVAFRTSWQIGFVLALISLGVTYEVFLRFNVVTNYPLSLGWSEGSRYYYASLIFSRSIYGEAVPLSPYHASRYILQSIPFLIPGLGIYTHRLWQFLLWIGLTTGASVTLAYRTIDTDRKLLRYVFAAWLFLFFLRVGVYYHLQIIVIITLLGVSKEHPWRSLTAIILASLWAGISRVNWFVMPAIMATAIYLLETPIPKNMFSSFRQLVSYFYYPTVWSMVGVVSAFVSQTSYVFLSGNVDNAKAFTSSFTSDLLWYRLLPNDSYAPGIILGILIISGPLLAGLIIATASHKKVWHPLRLGLLYLMIIGMFMGSMIVSVKIGGGGDLHNTDSYAVLLALIVAWFIGARVKADNGVIENWDILKPPIVVIAVIIPIAFLIPGLYPYPQYNENLNQAAHRQLIQSINEAGKRGPVLFISERQMISFGDVNVPLVSDYEVIILMEAAMSGNQAYLDYFYDDLKNHRFASIVAGKQNLGIKEEGVFYEENNAWNSLVSPYILCYYEPTQTIEADLRNIQIFTPRRVSECP